MTDTTLFINVLWSHYFATQRLFDVLYKAGYEYYYGVIHSFILFTSPFLIPVIAEALSVTVQTTLLR